MKNNISTSALGNHLIFAIPEADEALKNSHGDNQKKLLVVYREEEGKEHLAFLEKILKAVQFDLESDALLIPIGQEMAPSYAAISTRQTVSHVILFGVAPTALGLYFEIQPYEPLVHLETHFLLSDGLAELQNDKVKKGALWSALKSLFLP